MEIVRVVCPKCKTQLDVKNKQNVDQKLIKCPACGCQLMVRFNSGNAPQQGAAEEGKRTWYRRPGEMAPNNEGETMVASFNVSKGIGYLVFNDTKYQLKIGRNTIGRKSSTPQATIQIDTMGDNTMSRFHAVIEIVRMSDMSVRAIISNGSNKNPTYVSGTLLSGTDKLILKNGSEIKMGKIILRYELPA